MGEVITRQDRRNFGLAEVVRALPELGFTCQPATPPSRPCRLRPPPRTPLETDFRLLGAPDAARSEVPSGVRAPGPSRSETCSPALRRRLRALRVVR
ncbi:hypothetical protein [Streptomyces sp. S063]|uniref:hypothetical protein n=1 Tax=Streptomyces sp. S063 TaxID=2005885 RepID=UPI003FCD70B9